MYTLDPSIERLHSLTPASAPKWGQMNAQQMIEHLTMLMKVSNGKIKTKCITPGEKLPKYLAFLESDKPMPRSFEAPGLKELPPLEHSSIMEAANMLQKEVRAFHDHYEQGAESEVHPVFGSLNYEQWKRFHQKHFEHHLTQFGLL